MELTRQREEENSSSRSKTTFGDHLLRAKACAHVYYSILFNLQTTLGGLSSAGCPLLMGNPKATEVRNLPSSISGGAGLKPRSHSKAHTLLACDCLCRPISPKGSHFPAIQETPAWISLHIWTVFVMLFKLFSSARENQKHKQEE